MGVAFPYSQLRKGRYRYRRPVSLELQSVIGKTELTRALGETVKEAQRNWGTAHQEVERIFADGRPAVAQFPPTDVDIKHGGRYKDRTVRGTMYQDGLRETVRPNSLNSFTNFEYRG